MIFIIKVLPLLLHFLDKIERQFYIRVVRNEIAEQKTKFRYEVLTTIHQSLIHL